MRGSWIAVLAACFTLAAPVEAAELTGFGPIKFGMTRDEAFAAIGGKGTWYSDHELNYELLHRFLFFEDKEKLWVMQEFEDDHAATVRVQYQNPKLTRIYCIYIANFFAGIVSEKYDIKPIVRSDIRENSMRTGLEPDDTTDLFTFGFDSNAYIHISATSSASRELCKIVAAYYPPLKTPIPF